MSDLEQATEALKAADKAGNVQDARRLAEIVQKLATQEKVPTQTAAERRPGRVEQFMKENLVAPVAAGIAAVGREIRGPEGLPDLPEFEASAPTVKQSLKAALGTLATLDPKAQMDVIREQYPGSTFEKVSQDGKDYYIVNWTDPEGNTERGYLNAPGLTPRDLTQFAGQTVAFSPAGKAVGKIVPRMFKVGGKTAATSVGLDLTAEQMGSEQGIDYGQAGVTGLAGFLLEGLSPVASRAWGAIFRSRRYFDPNAGQLTEAGKKAAFDAGLDVPAMEAKAAREFSRLAEGGIDPDIAARSAARAEFDIPATRGQATQDYQQLNAEERLRKGLEGQEAQGVMREFDAAQKEAITKAQGTVSEKLTGRSPSGAEADLGDIVQRGLQRRERESAKAVDDAYQAVRDAGPAEFTSAAVSELPKRLSDSLASEVMDDVLTPASVRAQKNILELISGTEGKPTTLAEIEVARRRLNSFYDAASNRSDKRNIRIMKNALDEWIDDVADRGLLLGDENILSGLKKARELRTQYGKAFEGTRDQASSKIVENIWAKAESPEQVVNYLFGHGALGNKTQAVGAIRKIKDIVGPDSDEWQALREMAWKRLSLDKQGNPVSARVFEKNLNEALQQNGSLMKELYAQPEISFLMRYRDALKSTQAESTNPSQTAFALESAIRYTLRRFGQRESFTKGNVGTGTLLNFLARMPINPLGASDYAKRRQAADATRRLEPLPGSAPWFVGGGVAGAGAINEPEE